MGENINTGNGKVNIVTGEERTGTGTGNNSTSTDSTSTSNRDGRRTGTGTGTGTGERTEGRTEEKNVSPVVTVDTGLSDEERKKEERNAKRRERYARQKAEGGQVVKPRKVNAKKKDETPSISNEQINALVMSLFAIIGSRPNCEQWLLTESEVDSITKPLMNIIKESEKVEMLAEHSNQIALAFACITVFVPRLVVTVQKMKTEKEKERNAKQQATETKGSSEKPNNGNVRKSTADGKESSDGLSFFGLPIS